MQMSKSVSLAAWALLAFITFVTLSPYAIRPELAEAETDVVVILERVGAFGLLGLLFLISYPERRRTVCILVLGSAVVLELAQIVTSDRHARFVDALQKIVGGGAGILVGVALLSFLMDARLRGTQDQQSQVIPKKMFDGEFAELEVGFLAIVLFGLALVIIQMIGS